MNHPLRVYFSIPSQQDLVDITHNSEYPVPSDWLTDLRDTLERLALFPALGRQRNEFRAGLRSIVIGSFVVFYQFEGGEIEIARILHGSRDLEAIFLNNN